MACTPVFLNEIPYGCLMDIVSDIRTNQIKLSTATKVTWVLGCALNLFDGEENNVVGLVEPSPVTADGIAARISEICASAEGYALTGERWRPNPENVKALIQLLKDLLPLFLPLFI
jgi:hypothetical protein